MEFNDLLYKISALDDRDRCLALTEVCSELLRPLLPDVALTALDTVQAVCRSDDPIVDRVRLAKRPCFAFWRANYELHTETPDACALRAVIGALQPTVKDTIELALWFLRFTYRALGALQGHENGERGEIDESHPIGHSIAAIIDAAL
jgi:hypothetical protein